MTLAEFEIMLLVVVPAFPALASLILLTKGGYRDTSPSLRERTLMAVRDWLIASAIAYLALTRIMGWNISRDLFLVILATALLLISLPSIWWLWLYYRGAFRDGSAE